MPGRWGASPIVAVVGQKHEMLDQVPVAFVIRGPDAPASEEPSTRRGHPGPLRRPARRLQGARARSISGTSFPVATLDKVAKNKLREIADALADADG